MIGAGLGKRMAVGTARWVLNRLDPPPPVPRTPHVQESEQGKARVRRFAFNDDSSRACRVEDSMRLHDDELEGYVLFMLHDGRIDLSAQVDQDDWPSFTEAARRLVAARADR